MIFLQRQVQACIRAQLSVALRLRESCDFVLQALHAVCNVQLEVLSLLRGLWTQNRSSGCLFTVASLD